MQHWAEILGDSIRARGADAGYEDIRVTNASRGLNLLGADILASDKESTAGTKNDEYSETGAHGKRMGWSTAGVTGLTNSLNGVGEYKSETSNYPIVADNGVLKKIQNSVATVLSSSVTVDPTARISMTPLFQKTYFWDRINGGAVWDGTTLTRPGTMPKAGASVIYKGYHVAFLVPGQQFRLYLAPANEPSRFTRAAAPTDPNDIGLNDAVNVPGATVFTGDNSPRAIDINKNDGQAVTGVGFFGDYLIVFKENSIYQLSFNDNNGFVVQRISNTYGCVSHWSIASVENDTYFLTDKGIFVLGNEPNYYAAIRTNELSSRVKGLIQQINAAAYEKCNAWYYDDRYFLSVPLNGTDNNAMIVYDRRFYAWSVWDNIRARSMLVFKDKDVTGRKFFYFTDTAAARLNVFTPGVFNDNGAAINCVIRTRAFYGKLLDREKYWYQLTPIMRSVAGDVYIAFITENGTAGIPVRVSASAIGGIGVDQWGNLLWGTSQQDTYTDVDLGLTGSSSSTSSSTTDTSHQPFNIHMGIDSRTMKIEYSNNVVNEAFFILGWVMTYQTKDAGRVDGNYMYR